jgi:hypothetical protein
MFDPLCPNNFNILFLISAARYGELHHFFSYGVFMILQIPFSVTGPYYLPQNFPLLFAYLYILWKHLSAWFPATYHLLFVCVVIIASYYSVIWYVASA